MKIFEVEITGKTPLMHHRMPEEELHKLLGFKSERKKDKEELTPRQIAERHAYMNKDGEYYIPSEYISGAFASIASDYKQKNSIRKSIKSIAGGVFRPIDQQCILEDETGVVLKTFEVDIRKATNHQKGAVAVCRPRFDRWKTRLQIQIDDSLVSEKTVLDMLNDAGRRAGIGSYRVARGGYFGAFQVTKFEEIKK